MTIDLKPALVRILKPNGTTAGTGFVVTDDGLIATCAHVVGACGAGPGDTVRVVFHVTGGEQDARVEPEWWRDPDAEDVAILRMMERSLPERVTPLPLGSSRDSRGHPFRSRGYRLSDDFPAGLEAKGEIEGHIIYGNQEVLQLLTNQIDAGMSGAPLWDVKGRRVVGMVNAFWETTRHQDAWLAFAIPTETLRAVCPALQLSDVCPYRSLDAFTEADAEFLFGRQRVVDRLVESLCYDPCFLAVLGPSGSGKSSLVQAGLIPQLRKGAVPDSDRWGVVVTRPADDPFGQLEAEGLAGASQGLIEAVQAWLDRHPDQTRLVLVVDQFEELLIPGSEELRRRFVAELTRLLETRVDVTVVLVMRDDFYGRFAQEATALLAWLERGLVNVPPTLDRDELRAIVEEPAGAVGLTFETGLVDAILAEAMESAFEGEGQVGRNTILPLLEFALTQLWERRQDGLLTHEAYQAIGGVTGGLTQWANRTYYGLDKEQQRLARRVLTDLVHLRDESQGLPDKGRRKPLAELWRDEDERETVHEVVRHLANARLLVTGRDLQGGQERVELIHDALLREWGLLRGWLREDRRFLAWRQAMEGRVQAWEKAGRDEGALLRGRELAEAEQWLAERRDELKADRRDFIQKSIRRERQRRTLTLVAVTMTLVLISLAALYAWRQRDKAVAEQRFSRSRELAAIAINQLEVDPEIGLLLAMEAVRTEYTVQAEDALRQALALPWQVTLHGHTAWVWSAAYSPDGQWIVTTGDDRTARVWDAQSGQQKMILRHPFWVYSAAYSPDGRWIVTAGADEVARVWDAQNGQQKMTLRGHVGPVESAVYSPNGHWIATAGRDGTAQMWDAQSGQRKLVLEGHTDTVESAAYSPDGQWIVTASRDGTARVWEIESGQQQMVLEHAAPVHSAAYSPDGKSIVTASDDSTARVWNIQSRQQSMVLHGHMAWVNSAVYSPDGRWIVTASADGTVRVWEAGSGRQRETLSRHASWVYSAAYSPDGQWIVIASRDGTARVCSAQSKQQKSVLQGHMDRAESAAYSPNGQWIVTASADGTARVWDVQSGEQRTVLKHTDSVNSAFYSPDGKWIVTASEDGTARVWDTQSEQQERIFRGHAGSVASAIYSPDGQWIVTAGDDGTAQVWDVRSGQQKAVLRGHTGPVKSAAYSSDGKWIVTAGEDGTARLWEAQSGQQKTQLKHIAPVESAAYSPDGKWIVTASEDGTARVWDTRSGQQRMVLEGHTVWVNSAVYSPDGRWIVTASKDGTARVWEATSGQQQEVVLKHTGSVNSAAFSPDGEWIVTAGEDGTARVWSWPDVENLLAEARSRVAREFTCQERVQYLYEDLDCGAQTP